MSTGSADKAAQRRARVAAGAATLSENDDPRWWAADAGRAVDLATLDLSTTDCCVLAQRCPLDALADATGLESPDMLAGYHYDQAYAVNAVRLAGESSWVPGVEAWARAHGFTGYPGELGALTAEWRRVITGLREAVASRG